MIWFWIGSHANTTPAQAALGSKTTDLQVQTRFIAGREHYCGVGGQSFAEQRLAADAYSLVSL
jgi:hypothetical protein